MNTVQGIYISAILIIIGVIVDIVAIFKDADDFDAERRTRLILKVIAFFLEIIGLLLLVQFLNIDTRIVFRENTAMFTVIQSYIGAQCVKNLIGILVCDQELGVSANTNSVTYITGFTVLLVVSLILIFVRLGW